MGEYYRVLNFIERIPQHIEGMLWLIILTGFFIYIIKKGWLESVIFNEDQSIRGSFINMGLTLMFAVLICYGAFRKEVAENLRSMDTLMLGVYGISFGGWVGKKVLEKKFGPEPCPDPPPQGGGT